MRTLSIINLKGGVGKTITAVNMAHILATGHQKRVLIIDADKQGNTTKFFGAHDESKPSLADVITLRLPIERVIQYTRYAMIDIIPANMTLLTADREVLLDVAIPQQSRIKNELDSVADKYDFCVIDNAPDFNMSAINSLVASDDIIIPIKIDKFSFDGLGVLVEQVRRIQRNFNPKLRIAGCVLTMMQKSNVNATGEEYMRKACGLPVFATCIHRTVSIDESTFKGAPITEYAPRSTAAVDYCKLVTEYLVMC